MEREKVEREAIIKAQEQELKDYYDEIPESGKPQLMLQ